MQRNSNPYSNYSYYTIEEIAIDNWNNFPKLLELHSDALKFRRTPFAKELKVKIEEQLKYIVFKNRRNRLVLEEIQLYLIFEGTEFAVNLSAEIDKRLGKLNPEYFAFPSTELIGNSGEIKIDRQKKGLLLAVGYETGQKAIDNGIDENKRRAVLDNLYTGSIPKNSGIKNIKIWGDPESSARLREIVYQIAHFTKQEKGNYTGDYSISISDREFDLKYLKKKYYDNSRYDWEYPET